VHEQVKGDFNAASRLHLKRRILDALDEAHSFPLPPAMVEAEFAAIWAQVEAELKREGKTASDEGKSEDELKAEYRAIAERRVRLGLVLGKLGEQNGIMISGDEVNRAILARARQFPGQEQQVFQYYANNPQAQAEVRAPLFEDKVVDFIAELAQVDTKSVDRETLFKDPDDLPESVKSGARSP
jgi:trigger factor